MNLENLIPLKPEPDNKDWQRKMRALLHNDWLVKKTERGRRLQEQFCYLAKHAKTVVRGGPGFVIDLGSGPGELLEICRHLGHQIYAVDAVAGYGGMGEEYVSYSSLMRQRQEIPTCQGNFEYWVDCKLQQEPATLINSRGSWEQMFSKYQLGEPHSVHHDSKRLNWDLSSQALQEFTQAALKKIHAALAVNGRLVVHFNCARNHRDYLQWFLPLTDEAGLFHCAYAEDIYYWTKV